MPRRARRRPQNCGGLLDLEATTSVAAVGSCRSTAAFINITSTILCVVNTRRATGSRVLTGAVSLRAGSTALPHHHEHHEVGLRSLNRRRVLQRQMDALERKETLVRVMGPTMPPHG